MRLILLFIAAPVLMLAQWANGYTYRSVVTVPDASVAGTANFTDFTVPISDTFDGTGGEPDLRTTANGGQIQSTATCAIADRGTCAADLRFETTGGTKLSHLIESYTATTGAITVKVKVPTLNAQADTTFHMFWGKASVSPTEETVASTYESGAKVVYGFGEDPASASIADESNNSNTGTVSGNPTRVTGKVGYATDFDGTGDWLKKASNTTLDLDDYTVSVWVYGDAISSTATALNFVACRANDASGNPGHWCLKLYGEGSSQHSLRLYLPYSTSTTNYAANSAQALVSTAFSNSNGVWAHLVVTKSGTSYVGYRNGSQIVSNTEATAPTKAGPLQIGTLRDGAVGFNINGKLDEFKYIDGAKTPDWVTTTYAAENTPTAGGFFTMGSPAENSESSESEPTVIIF